ncbi:hypothetical protein C9994_09000 [Marivirga lumbricoides]|uniref:TonB-dependent receptor n=1 Tax=Marivirga lumbricoides TaxID=1046115 RepID=A0A2T4DQQ9_9BACT|nr:hypothetical protein C9994_09000 [Marivirga lumbricoides]
MSKKVFLLVYLTFRLIVVQGQTINVKGKIIDDELSPVQFASILNISTQEFTFTNSNGYFKLECQKGDTLEISHLSYHSKQIIIETHPIEVSLDAKIQILDEVVVSGKPKEEILLKQKIKKKAQFGLAMNSDYIFEIENSSSNVLKLKSINIPINFRKEYLDEGYLILAIGKSKKNILNASESSSLLKFQVAELIGEKEILAKIENNNIYLDPGQNMFIFMKRVVSDKVFSNKGKSLSVNPFIFISEMDENSSISSQVRILGQEEWIDISSWFGFNPTFDIRINAQVIE